MSGRDDLVKVARDNESTREIAASALASGTGGVLSNLSPLRKSDFRMLMKSEIAELKLIWDERPEEIMIVGIIRTPCEKTNEETGEISDGFRTVLIDVDGNGWLTMGGKCATVFGMIANVTAGKGQFGPPIKAKFEYLKIGPKRYMILPKISDEDLDTILGD